MSKPSDPFEDLDPHPFTDSPYSAGAPRERAPQPPPGYPYGPPQGQWAPSPYSQEGDYGDGQQASWRGQEGYPGYPYPQQPPPGNAYPQFIPPTYRNEGYMGEISQPPYFGQTSDIQPWTIPAAPMLSSRSWPDVSGNSLAMFSARQPSLARPLPRWLLIVATVATVVLLAVLVGTGKDWADGALHAGIAAGAMAVLILLITIIRSFGGLAASTNDRRQVQLTGATLVMVILLVLSGTGIGLQSPIHRAQAGTLESSQQWQRAIDELRLAGESAPTSEELARVYDTWGEHLSAGMRYGEAISKFAVVLDTYRAASQGVRRAATDSITAYIAWGKQASLIKSYREATLHFDDLLKQAYCLDACQNQASALDATAYYNLAETALSAQNYADAASAFAALATRFSTAGEVQKIHGDYATALLGWGKQQLTSSTCTDAVSTYQKLADGFADTDPGQQAITALSAPQPVMGQLTTANAALKIKAILAANLQVNASTSAPTIASFDTVATAPLNSAGAFQFAPVPQGHYPLLWQFTSGGKQQTITFINQDGSNTPAFVANVGPLCPYDFGAITQSLGA